MPAIPHSDGGKNAPHISIVLNKSVEQYLEFYETNREIFQSWLDISDVYLPVMRDIFRIKGLPTELVYVSMIESGLNSHAVSSARAVGPWQFMPETARALGLRTDQWVDERRDYIKSTIAAARYFRMLHDRFGSWSLALAAYNGGEGKVQSAIRQTGSRDFWDLRASTYLLKETKNFVPRFMAVALIARNPAAYGFRVPVREALCFDVIVVRNGSADLYRLANSSGSTYAAIKQLNPEINGRYTPPDRPYYILRIPLGKKNMFIANQDKTEEYLKIVPWETGFHASLIQRNGTAETPMRLPIPYSTTTRKFTLAERPDKPAALATLDAATNTEDSVPKNIPDRELPFIPDLNRPRTLEPDQDIDL